MNQNGKVQFVALDKIKPAVFNPASRISHKSISDLRASIERVGIIQPLVVTKDFDLVDGHRRLECARMLGMAEVPVIVREGEQSQLFVELNTTAKRMSKADDLEVYLSGGCMTGRSKKDIEVMEKLTGREFLTYMAENHISPASCMNIMAMLMKYIKKDEPDWRSGNNEFAKKAARWLILKKQQFAVRAALYQHISPEYIQTCIEKDEAIS